MAVHHIPDGYSAVTPYIIVDDGAAALEFYKAAFGAVELMRMEMPDGKIGHAEFSIGNSNIMLAAEFPELGALSPTTIGNTPVSILLYVEHCDEMFDRAITGGATVLRPMQDQFYGDRSGTLQDPYGHHWTVATHVEDVDPEELERRSKEWAKQAG